MDCLLFILQMDTPYRAEAVVEISLLCNSYKSLTV